MSNKRNKKPVIALSALLIGGCLVLLLYMTLFRWVDYATCIAPIARKVGVPSTMDGIESYILETATPGMEREQVLKVLETLGPVDLRFQDVSYPPNEVRDTIFIKSCMHPLNNLEIHAFYSSDGRLISISLLNND
jgi:hypothetical protein